MAVSILGAITVADFLPAATSFTVDDHEVTAGTDTLLAIWVTRVHSASTIPVFGGEWNEDALDPIASNYVAGIKFDDFAFWIGAINAPDAGVHDFVLGAIAQQRGGTLVLINLDGNDTSDILGALDAQARAATATASVSLQISPETADGLAIAVLGIAQDTTLSSFAGSGWTLVDTDRSTSNNLLTRTIRTKASPATPTTAGATFGASDENIGGVLLEIRAASTTYTLEAEVAAAPGLAAGTGAASRGTAPNAHWFEGAAEWTSTLILEADDTDQGRNMVRVGSPATTRFIMRRSAIGSGGVPDVFMCKALLADGAVQVESAAGALSTGPSVVSFAQRPGDGGHLTVDGLDQPPSYRVGADLIGGVALASDPVEVGGTDANGLAAYSGLLALWIVDGRFWGYEQRRAFSRAVLQPELMFGWGQPDAATDANRSPIALPMFRVLAGAARIDIALDMIDPDGTVPEIVAVGAPLHGTAEIVAGRVRYTATPGYVGQDRFSYTIGDGEKSSTSWIEVATTGGTLVAVPDPVSVLQGGSVGFDPRANDTGGSGPLTIVDVGEPTLGAVALTSENRLIYRSTGEPGTDRFSYTISDGTAQASADVVVTIAATTADVVANDDSAATTQGAAIDIPVLDNDTPEGVVVDAVTSGPAHGTAVISGSTIRYTPASGFTGQDGFWYRTRLPATGGTDTATVSVVVSSTTLPATYPKHPPTVAASRILTVGYTGPGGTANQYDSLDAAFGAVPAAGGYRIRLNDVEVDKSSGWTLDRVFGDQVVIESRNALGATLNGRIYAQRGRKIWLYNLQHTCPENQLVQNSTKTKAQKGALTINSDFTVTRCRLLAWFSVNVIANTDADDQGRGSFQAARRFYLAWNAFVGRNDIGHGSACHIKLRCSDVGAGANVEFDDFAIGRNFFYDPSVGNNASNVPETFNIYIGDTKTFHPDYFVSPNGLIEYNFFASGNIRRTIYLKRAVGQVRFNHVAGYKNEPFTQRHGWGGKWIANRCSAGGGNFLLGGGRKPAPYNSGATELIGNVITGGIQAKCGTANGSTYEQAANYAVLVGNRANGNTVIGDRRNDSFKLSDAEGGKLKHLKLYEHTGGYSVETALVEGPTLDLRPNFTGHGYAIPAAPTLSAAVVGLETVAQ